MQKSADQFPSQNNFAPQPQTLSHREKPSWLAIAFLVTLPLLLAIVLIAIFMTVPEIPPKLPNISTKCILSVEANRSGLTNVIKEIQNAYFRELHPEMIAMRPGVTTAEVRKYFVPYDPDPSSIKKKTKRAEELLQDLKNIKYNENELKLRERAAYYIARNIMRNNFGWGPRAQNYYAADWMLGPDHFCWEPICGVTFVLELTLPHFVPYNLSDANKLREMLMKHNETAEQYMTNLRTGWKAGIVRSKDGCDDGLHAIKYGLYEPITLKGEKAILDTPLAAIFKGGYFEHLSSADNKTWKELYEKDVDQYFTDSLVEYVGKPIKRILKFLEEEHSRRCVDPSMTSGLGTLPLSFEYLDGTSDSSKTTTQELPDGTALVGSDLYKRLMSFYTTTLITPEQLREKAWARLQEVYGEAVDIAKQYTQETNNNTAVKKFKDLLIKNDKAFNSEAFPPKESNENAFVECRNHELAEKNCPQRWKAMKEWIKSTKKSMQDIRPKLESLFYFTGSKKTTPDCPVTVEASYLPVASYHLYTTAMTSVCSDTTAVQGLPFFVQRFGPTYTEWTTTAHEQLPGHHLEVQGYNENFADTCNDAVGWLFHNNYFNAFTEGWATYVEGKLLPRDTDLYSNTNNREVLLQKYGMVHYQVLAALRAVVDIDLNFNTKTRQDGLNLYEQYVWHDGTHMATLDTKMMQTLPGFTTAYMYGEMEITRVRTIVQKELGPEFSLKEFHYQLLRLGEHPVDYIEKYFRYYISCKKGSGLMTDGCIEALS